eukprot:15356463-Alexandrium_andersonii.AAC.1
MPSGLRHRAPVPQRRRPPSRCAHRAVPSCTRSRRSILSVGRWVRPGLCLIQRPTAGAPPPPRLGGGP